MAQSTRRMTQHKKTRFGFIGAGAIAQRRHLPEARANRHTEVASIADPVPQRVEGLAREYGAQPFTDYRRMLGDVELDAVVVAGPNALHAEMAIDSLRAGLHVLCEKPMATTLTDARAIIAAAAKARKKLMIAMNQRFMPQHVRAKAILDAGKLGRPLSFEATFAHGGPEAWSVDGAASWFTRKDAAGFGVLGDLGVHKIDLIRWLLGQEIVEVAAVLGTIAKRGPDGKPIALDDNAQLIVRTDGGATGTINLSWTAYGWHDNHTVICCEKGTLAMGIDPRSHLEVHHRNGSREALGFPGVGPTGWPGNSGVIDAFTDCIRRDRSVPVDGEQGIRDLAVVVAAVEAAQSGRTVNVGR
jgi:predicted dehydrogenase